MKTAISIVVAAALIGGAIFLSGGGDTVSTDNVFMANGTQVVEVTAKGNYSPKLTAAKADTPTVLRIKTNGTFDCTSALTIPALNYRQNLPPSGTTDIEIPPQKAGTNIQGRCAMGMYTFAVNFE